MALLPRMTAKILLIHANSILLCHQDREPMWHIPGGGIEGRETPEAAMRRELREEVGLPLAWAQPVTTLETRWQPFGQHEDTVVETMHLFVGQLQGMTPQGITTREQGLHLLWHPIGDVVACAMQVRPLDVIPWIVRMAGEMRGRYVV